MKPDSLISRASRSMPRRGPSLLLAVLVVPSAHGASATWNGSSDALWATGTNWSATPVPGAGDSATFDNAGNGNTTIDLGAGVTLGSLVFDTSNAAAYTIGSGAVGSQTLTLGNAGAMTINAGVTTSQLFNANVQLSNAANATATITNNGSGTLTIAGVLGANAASGNGILNVAGSGNTTITGGVTEVGAGSSALKKTGSGTLTLSNGSTFNGTGASQPRGTGSGGNSSFTGPMIVQEGTLLLNGGTHTVTGEAVIGGIAANNGDAGQNAKIQVDAGAMNVSSWLSVGRGNGVGGVSSQLVLNNAATVTAANFSAGFNGGSGLNLPKGSITLNGTSSLGINSGGRFHFAESAGSDFTMTLNGSSSVTLNGDSGGTDRRFIGGGGGGTGVLTLNDSATFTDQGAANSFNVGYQNGNGELNINSGTNFTTGAEIRVAASNGNGTFSGTGEINVNGGTLNMAALTLARNNNDVASTFNATVNVTSGTVNVKTGQSLIGWRGTASSGTLNISGGSFNQGTTTTANMVIGSFAGTTGTVNVSGTGELNFQNNSSLRFSDVANANAARTLDISGGKVTFYSDAGTTEGGTGVIDLMFASNPTGTSTIHLNGGTLTANQIKASSATGTRVINFNGGTLEAASSNAAFLAGGTASTANVRNGGAIIDTNGKNVTIGQSLVHSTIGGDNAIDGGLTKLGTGTLTLTGTNTYTGATTIASGGTLALTGTGSIANSSDIVVNGTLDVSGLAASTFTIGTGQKLSGDGTVNATGKTLSIAGTHAVGNSPGQQDVTGNLNYQSNSIFSWDLNAVATDPGAAAVNQGSYDQVAVSGDLTGSGAIFHILLGTNSFTDAFWDTSKSWNNIFTAGSGFDLASIFTSFGGLGVDSAGVVAGQGSFSFTGGNTLSWAAVPEPGGASAALLVAAGLWRRQRRKLPR